MNAFETSMNFFYLINYSINLNISNFNKIKLSLGWKITVTCGLFALC